MVSGSLSRGIFGSNRLQKLCSGNFCVFESVLAFLNTKTGRRVLGEGYSKATRAQTLPMSLTDTLFAYHPYLYAKLKICTLLKESIQLTSYTNIAIMHISSTLKDP